MARFHRVNQPSICQRDEKQQQQQNGQTAELQAFTTWVYGAAFHRINLPAICRRNKNKTTNNRVWVYGALSQNYSTFHLPKKRETTTKQTNTGATSLHHLGLRLAFTEVLCLPSPKETREKKQKQPPPNSTATSLHHPGLWPAFTELIHLPRAKEIANKQKPPKQTNKQTKTNKQNKKTRGRRKKKRVTDYELSGRVRDAETGCES